VPLLYAAVAAKATLSLFAFRNFKTPLNVNKK
jgi:hypothetical protein